MSSHNCLFVLFTDLLLFFYLSVSQLACLNQPPFLPVMLIESLAFCQTSPSICQCKSLCYQESTVFEQPTSSLLYSVFCSCAVTVVFWGRRLRNWAYPVTTTCPWDTSVAWCPGPAVWMEPQTTRPHPQNKLNVRGKKAVCIMYLILTLFASKQESSFTVKVE